MKISKITISNPDLDRRVKLKQEDKEEIRELYAGGGYSYSQLARLYGVSKRTISFIIKPEQLEANIKRRKERGGWKQYYNKEKWCKDMKEHREYKKMLRDKGLI